MILAAALVLQESTWATAHGDARIPEEWPRASEMLRVPGVPDTDIVRSARLDLAERGAEIRAPSVEFARWLLSTMSNPEFQLDAARSVEILRAFGSESEEDTTSFWFEFSLASFQQMAGNNLAVASTLARALKLAEADEVPIEVVARTRGIMGHAQQAGGVLDEARRTFENLEANSAERAHATVHLGEIALTIDGIGAGLEIWLNHPDGTERGVAIVVDEADALWRSDPERSYRLVEEALAHLDRHVGQELSPGIALAVTRLKARGRENAMSPLTELVSPEQHWIRTR